MFGARKACYKCGNGVSAPFYITCAEANAGQLMELDTLRKLSPFTPLPAFDSRSADCAEERLCFNCKKPGAFLLIVCGHRLPSLTDVI